jgi:hypothetical protein
MIELGLLAVEFIIGMWMNLFATFPTLNPSYPMFGMMDVMFSVPELMVHMMVGVLVGLLSLMIFMMAIMNGNRTLIVVSTIGSVSILVSGISGLEFMFSGFQNNIFSFAMSVGFIFTVISYFLFIYYTSVNK